MLQSADADSFARAMAMRDQGNLVSAIELIRDLINKYPDNCKLYYALGHLYWKAKRFGEAVNSFESSIAYQPDMKHASLGLFHCLWEQGKRVEALDEARRFLAIADCEEYEEIIREINT